MFLTLPFKSEEPIPFSKEIEEKIGKGFHHKGKTFIHYSNLDSSETAFFRLSRPQFKILLFLGFLLLASFVINWHLTLIILLILLTSLYFIDIFFNLYLIIKSFSKTPEIKISKKEIENLADNELPTYTIFCPLYKEWRVIPQFVTAMSRLDYPKDKLQVMLLLEEDDQATLAKVSTFNLPEYFEVFVIPDSLPKTKPKACNFGLQKAKGEYCVIFDAEDIPEKDQLKKAFLAFQKVDPKIACIQAKLNFYNPHHNILTKVFTSEYSLWFDLILTGLQSINALIPLGGTSNHFKTSMLHQLKGWDAFNVTEDCDLGIRLVKKGYQTAIVDSTTHEEANSNLKNWMGQRSRWVKGYIQSYFVHMRDPKAFLQDFKNPHLFTFQIVIGGKVLSMLINPLLWILTISYFVFRPTLGHFIESFFPGPLLYLAVFSAVVGNFLYFYYYMIGCAKRGYYDLIKFGFLVPIYWLMMSVATWIALYKIIAEPHYWFKTKHGLHLNSDKTINQANLVIGQELVDITLQKTPRLEFFHEVK